MLATLGVIAVGALLETLGQPLSSKLRLTLLATTISRCPGRKASKASAGNFP
jgi:hypothetical protein